MACSTRNRYSLHLYQNVVLVVGVGTRHASIIVRIITFLLLRIAIVRKAPNTETQGIHHLSRRAPRMPSIPAIDYVIIDPKKRNHSGFSIETVG